MEGIQGEGKRGVKEIENESGKVKGSREGREEGRSVRRKGGEVNKVGKRGD